MLPVVHAVTNDEIVARASFVDQARAVMRGLGSQGALQLRAPHLAQNRAVQFVELALTLAEEQERTGAWLIINDRVDVALIACARGVQLTTRSFTVTDALQIIIAVSERDGPAGTATIAVGASVHSLEEGIAARIAGATWGIASDVLAGHASGKRPAAVESVEKSGPELLERLVRYCGIPVIAIGGITPLHVSSLRRVGAYGVAAIRGIWDTDHPERAATDYLSAYDSEVGR
jgi:thiazole tautomerase (transcriptional regulator TenI)